ncbi:hypothetical protein LIER_19058 [Lithospermum erythrorhizon]|uniref:Uncharacterized protein n=1 Tax=Lithospermum erythrorhizon TaxID=34254 RepID=A0AAV3QIZ2_LITER
MEEAEKRAKRGRRKDPMEEIRLRSPNPKRSAVDNIRAPDRGYSKANLPRVSAFSHLQGVAKKKREVWEGTIEYLTHLNASMRKRGMCSWKSRTSGCYRDLPGRRALRPRGI